MVACVIGIVNCEVIICPKSGSKLALTAWFVKKRAPWINVESKKEHGSTPTPLVCLFRAVRSANARRRYVPRNCGAAGHHWARGLGAYSEEINIRPWAATGHRPEKLSASVIACRMVFTIGLVSASLAKPRKHGSSIGDSALLCRLACPAASPEPNVSDAGGDDANFIKSPMSLFGF